jgi:hypothetical protein
MKRDPAPTASRRSFQEYKNMPGHKSTKKKRDLGFLDKIGPNDALAILRKLAGKSAAAARKIEKLATERAGDPHVDAVAADVCEALKTIDLERSWEETGSKNKDFHDPGDMLWRIFEETLDPFLASLKKSQDRMNTREAKRQCMGILKAIYLYHHDKQTDAAVRAADAPVEFFHAILEGWQECCGNTRDMREMAEFLRKNCSGWSG